MQLDSYTDAGVLVAIDLVNRLVIHPEITGREHDGPVALLAQVLSVDPPSVAQLQDSHGEAFMALAIELSEAFARFVSGDEDAAADRLNRHLAQNPAHPHLAKEGGRWRLHHHPTDAELVSMWTSICAEALARLLSAGYTSRVGACADPRCARIFVDTTRNGTRRFCSTTCQNRIKTATLRQRRKSMRRNDPATSPTVRD